ncbi:hypothetical protein [Planomicrobium sp. CPCC 101079]|uniref:hypothetical protein n=1 Tax=Planomicrobium sp. CPCC 101079 TaxID=2599618 RepID=UPI0011B37FA2|nr:hypothetical protein [Planomicrobium sp. CPCC 101079]TWT04632.1 hypothetical protein FQV28_08495 [Planomicrobium sp. CPCC 101079]
MAAQGQAAVSLATFNTSEKMADIRNIIQISEAMGNIATVFALEYLGSSREAIFIITLLRQDGYTVEHVENAIIVKSRKENEHAES